MRTVMFSVVAFVSAKIGRCSRCMRLSLRGALVGWGVAAVIHVFWPWTPVELLVLLWPMSFTVLWILHIATYGVRRTRMLREVMIHGLSHDRDIPRRQDQLEYTIMSRRRVLATFAQGVAVAVLASLSVPLRAGGQLPTYGMYCGAGNQCPHGDRECPHADCPPNNDSGLDAACMRHDKCYCDCPPEKNSFLGEQKGPCSLVGRANPTYPQRQAWIIRCNDVFCNDMKRLKPTTEAERYARRGAWTLFQCTCAQWDISGDWNITQDNVYTPTFSLRQQGGKVTGTAILSSADVARGNYASNTGPISGTVIGTKFEVLVTFRKRGGSTITGRYAGTLVPGYIINGKTGDAALSKTVGWSGEGPSLCIK